MNLNFQKFISSNISARLDATSLDLRTLTFLYASIAYLTCIQAPTSVVYWLSMEAVVKTTVQSLATEYDWLASLLSLFKAHTSISTINGSDIHYNYQHLVTMQFIISYNLLILLVLSLILTLILPITNNSLIIEMLQHIFCNSEC